MNFLAISGSNRRLSTNTAMLRALRDAGSGHEVTIHDGLGDLPVFSPDREGPDTPAAVLRFAEAVAAADGIIIASPEYVRSIPGGLKNAIDWLVSRDEIVAKPIALAHASHRGDDMLGQLRIVLGTVSAYFSEDCFLRFPLMKLAPEAIAARLSQPREQAEICAYLDAFASFCRGCA